LRTKVGQTLSPVNPAISTIFSQPPREGFLSYGRRRGQHRQLPDHGAPGYAGEYLVDVAVPSGLTSGNQPITISVNGATSPLTVGGSPVYLPIK
jgi:hypothetical protein